MPACCVSFQYTADTQCLCMQEGGSIPAGCAEQVSDAVPCPLRRQEELDPAAQGTARPQLGRVQQPGERHHPGDRQVRPRDGAAGRAGPARRPLPATTTAASHLRHRHAAASCGHELLPAGGAPAGGAPGARLATPCAPPTTGACGCCTLTDHVISETSSTFPESVSIKGIKQHIHTTVYYHGTLIKEKAFQYQIMGLHPIFFGTHLLYGWHHVACIWSVSRDVPWSL